MSAVVKVDTTVLDKITKNLNGNRNKVLKKAAFKIEAYAKEACPFDTGATRNSIYTETIDGAYQGGEQTNSGVVEAAVREKRPGANVLELPKAGGDVVAIVGPTTDYAIWLETGTSKMAARPFLKPAAERVIAEYSKPEAWKEMFE